MSSSTVTEPLLPALRLQRADFENVPIIDLSKLHSPNIWERQELAQKIDQACSEVGFFYIKVQFNLSRFSSALSEPMEANNMCRSSESWHFRGAD